LILLFRMNYQAGVRKFSIYIIFILITFYGTAFAQQTEFEDSLVNGSSESHLHLPEKLLSASEEKHTSNFIDTVTSRLKSNKWAKHLGSIVIMPPSKPITDTVGTEKSELVFENFKGKEIGSIKFVKLKPFGQSINDTVTQSLTWIDNTINAIHVNTSDRVLSGHLLFKKGDIVDPYTFSDNERILRELSFIEDAKIIIKERNDNPEIVDVIVLTIDVLSKAFFVELSGVNSGKLELWDRNIFGSGKEIQSNIYWDSDRTGLWGFEAFYSVRNILGSFVDSKILYQNLFDRDYIGIDLSRNFFTPNTKYAGGFAIGKTNSFRNVWYTDTSYSREAIDFKSSDLWLGRSFSINPVNSLGVRRQNLTFSSRFFMEEFSNRPEVQQKFLYEYHNKKLWLNSVSFTSRSFYKSNLIYSYGRTEDIPNGWMANLTLGREFGEFSDRTYTSASFSIGDYVLDLGYLYALAAWGGFFQTKDDFQQGLFNLQFNYFTNLFIFGQLKFRYFVKLNYLQGINRFAMERININDKQGIRGLVENSIYGQKKLTLNMEAVTFTPYQLLGFKIVGFGFTDFALIGPESSKFIDFDSYSGFGFGFRVRNERLVFPTFQFRFGFYPNIDGLLIEDMFKFSGEKKLNPANFRPTAPAILSY
jgi:hypothetical protein